ncbi:MAG: 4Fe-4S cluster-binding domain-containing protein [Desulfobacteraceae bacterium]|nr:4Fe-4S cluster-binding domain-containing protein [Desulfobacteraceae bacterium]
MQKPEPLYRQPNGRERLRQSRRIAFERLRCCSLCPRDCRVNRLEGETGFCRTGERAWLSSYSPHFGEESPLVGQGGSGTLFFTHCNLRCNFCQNYDISHEGAGTPLTKEQLAACMMDLQQAGCHNINFVTPSHVVPQILAAVETAVERGLRLPLVFNTSAYDRPETLRLLEGIVDIYMPDFKFWDPETALATCEASDYPEVARKALVEMHRQVGDLVVGEDGIAQRGVLLRHLVMPGGVDETRHIMRFVARQISASTYVNIMPQYRPCGQAAELAITARTLTAQDYRDAVAAARREGLHRLDERRKSFLLW